MRVLEEYLSTHIYNAIRIDEGLAYSPRSQQYSLANYGVFLIYADVDLDNMDAVLDLMHDEINKLATDPPDDEEIVLTKRKLLLAMVQGHESNSDLADYYVGASDELLLNGKLDDREARIESVTPDDVQRVASLYLAPGKTVVYQEVPVITYGQLYTGLVMLILGGVVVIVLVIKRHVAGRNYSGSPARKTGTSQL
jgi:predicted Zn-dependent peptidase